jgi:hypothetical protein
MQAEKQPAARPLRTRVVRGEPSQIVGWTLTPVARVTTYTRGRGTLHRDTISGWAAGMVRITPLGVRARTGDRQEWIPVHDVTASVLTRLALAGAAATLFLAAVRRLVRRRRAVS